MVLKASGGKNSGNSSGSTEIDQSTSVDAFHCIRLPFSYRLTSASRSSA